MDLLSGAIAIQDGTTDSWVPTCPGHCQVPIFHPPARELARRFETVTHDKRRTITSVFRRVLHLLMLG